MRMGGSQMKSKETCGFGDQSKEDFLAMLHQITPTGGSNKNVLPWLELTSVLVNVFVALSWKRLQSLPRSGFLPMCLSQANLREV